MYIATSLGIKNQPHGKKHTMSRGQDLRTNQPTQVAYKAKHFHVFYYSSKYVPMFVQGMSSSVLGICMLGIKFFVLCTLKLE